MNVAGKPVELGDRDRALVLLGLGQRRRQLRALVERIGALAGLDLDELSHDFEALGLGKPGNGGALRFKTKAGLGLLAGGNADIGDNSHDRNPCCIERQGAFALQP